VREEYSRIGPQTDAQLRELIANYYGMISLVDHQLGRLLAALHDEGLTEDTIVSVETLVYSVNQDKLVWAGMSETTNPSKVDAFIKELSTGAIKEMKKAGLLVPAK